MAVRLTLYIEKSDEFSLTKIIPCLETTDTVGYNRSELEIDIKDLALKAVTHLLESFGVDASVVMCEYGYQQNVLSGEIDLNIS